MRYCSSFRSDSCTKHNELFRKGIIREKRSVDLDMKR